MAKGKKTVYVCQECGYEAPKWLGKCPGCNAWNTMREEKIVPADKTENTFSLGENSKPEAITAIELSDLPRFSSGSAELDRVLGGGVIPGSLILIVGDPGVGKSSLTLKACARIAMAGKNVLYVTGEESARQVRMRADRLNALSDRLLVVSETDWDRISAHISNTKPEFLVVDSIQTIFQPELGSAPGSVSQVRECAAALMRLAKTSGVAIFTVGHVTKDGTLAGPRVLEHIVDTVLYFEGETRGDYRVLRAVKNRFGSTNELGLFAMTAAGLIDVPEAASLFLSDREGDSGAVVIPTLEGTRPLLVELQALVAPTPYAPPHRTSDAVDIKRLQLLLAVLEKRVPLSIGASDVYVKVAGGLKIDDPAADLGICVAMASSFANRKILPKTVIMGEVGLSGEVRPISQAETRLAEAERLGFTSAVLPEKNCEQVKDASGLTLYAAASIRQALSLAMPREKK